MLLVPPFSPPLVLLHVTLSQFANTQMKQLYIGNGYMTTSGEIRNNSTRNCETTLNTFLEAAAGMATPQHMVTTHTTCHHNLQGGI